MGLERRGGKLFYYRKVRRGGRVVSEYQGSGTSALLMAQLDEIERKRRQESLDEWRAERERLDTLEAEAVELFDRVEALVKEFMEEAGYHRHKRGEWRKRRGTE